jgi:superfamily II DNA or RNA helicase
MELRPYQVEGINNVARKVQQGYKRIVCQLPTGGGKTVMFAGLCKRYLTSNPDKNILILVHREELLVQARKTIYDWHGIVAETITAGSRYVAPARIHVGMVETMNKRLDIMSNYIKNVGMLIIDECHIANFNKVLSAFDHAITIGYTATPISASRKRPLNGIYEQIVCCVDIPELIRIGSLVDCDAYAAKNIDRKMFHIANNGDFDQKEMSDTFSGVKHVKNTVLGYEHHAMGKKTMIFNCSVEHSLLVTAAFAEKGYPVAHIDATVHKSMRDQTIKWFRETPGAILNNIGILTTGFDEPSIEAIIVNKATKSLPLWLQMCGRGSRPYAGKQHFTIVDMGDNYIEHFNWNEGRNWEHAFNNPQDPIKRVGTAPIKICVQCEAMISINSYICKFCNAEQPRPEHSYDDKLIEFVRVTRGSEIKDLVDRNKAMTKQDGTPFSTWNGLHMIKDELIRNTKYKLKIKPPISHDTALMIMNAFQIKTKEWCALVGKKYSDRVKDYADEIIQQAIKDVFLWPSSSGI